ncbi:M48 family metalloprotease [Celerinatantimonas sp. YJH-8]|uniref:beta-barrel assembly-enhancing protease n=1 Tax=Celerinatantimonas sp. YJH-8 TaxID=3228714 RepID=UPI0038CA815B
MNFRHKNQTRLAIFSRRWLCYSLFPLLLCGGFPSFTAAADDALPQLGTAGVQALSIAKERQYGDAFMRMSRASGGIINDPVLTDFINQLGYRLVSNADGVRFPFHFFLVNDPTINAAAFLGGYVKVNSGLFLYAQSESELAAVLAHEISHVTQRHIARSIENAAQNNHLTIAGLLGSVILSIANPAAGIAAMQTSIAASIQGKINFTRQNEEEADRIGMQVLARSGFKPSAMATFFGRLASKYRYTTKPPEILADHPLTANRIADAQARASQYPNKYVAPDLDFQLAKSRIQVRFGTMDAEQALSEFKHQLQTQQYVLRDAALYGEALALFAEKNYQEAQKIIEDLAHRYPENLFFLDTQSDILLAMNQTAQAIKLLNTTRQRLPDNPVVILNLAVAYDQAKQYAKEAQLLDHYLRTHPDQILAWQMLTESYQRQQLDGKALQSQAEYFALRGQYQLAIKRLQSATFQDNNRLDEARIKARIEQFKVAQADLDKLQN